MGSYIIKEGDTVIFDINGEKQSFIIVRPQTKVKVGKAFLSVEPLIGCPFGSMFELSEDGRSLERSEHMPSTDWQMGAEVTRNNSKLNDANKINQPIQQAEIQAMREAGKMGSEIVEALTNNSATFETKSEFAQEKYKKRKSKKYVMLACARRPTAAAICAAHFNKHPARIAHVRPDAVGILLHMANVCPGARILVLESSNGLITGAVAERLGGHGVVCATYLGNRAPSIDIVRSFDFSAEVRAAVKQVPLLKLLQQQQQQQQQEQEQQEQQQQQVGEEEGSGNVAKKAKMATTIVDNAAATPTVVQVTIAEEGEEEEKKEETTTTVAEPMDATTTTATAETKENEEVEPTTNATTTTAIPENTTTTCAPPFSGCILVGCPLHPETALKALFPLLTPSASFAVVSQHLQPLAEVMHSLRISGWANNMAVQEPWYREQQVLPGRTHPTMAMNHGGGYLLSGTVTLAGTKLPLKIPSVVAAAPPAVEGTQHTVVE